MEAHIPVIAEPRRMSDDQGKEEANVETGEKAAIALQLLVGERTHCKRF